MTTRGAAPEIRPFTDEDFLATIPLLIARAPSEDLAEFMREIEQKVRERVGKKAAAQQLQLDFA